MMLALLGAVLIGLTLGLLGSGGSIVTVPVLVYLAGQPEKVAIAGSLGIVGAVALAGAVPYVLRRRVSWRSVAWFGVPGMAGTWLGAWASRFVPGAVQLLLFALVMLGAAWLMLRPRRIERAEPARRAGAKIAVDGLAVGALTGLVGVGGGFLIVPALVLLAGLEMALAVGTSLVIIGLKSLSGFAEYLNVLAGQGLALDWGLLALFTGIGIAGTLLGSHIGHRMPQDVLRRTFGAALVIVGTGILGHTLIPMVNA